MSTTIAANASSQFEMPDALPNREELRAVIAARQIEGANYDPQQIESMLRDIFHRERPAASVSTTLIAGMYLVEGYVELIASQELAGKDYDKDTIYQIGYKAVEKHVRDNAKETRITSLLDQIFAAYEGELLNLEQCECVEPTQNEMTSAEIKLKQRRQALELANGVRSRKAVKMRQIKNLELHPKEAINDPDVSSSTTINFLLAIPGVGNTKANKIINELGLDPDKRIKDLTAWKLSQLTQALPQPRQARSNHGNVKGRTPERKAAREKANAYRERRAEIKESIGKGEISLTSVLDEPALAKMRLSELLALVRFQTSRDHLSQPRRNKILRAAGVSKTKTCGKLTDRQKQILAEVIPKYGGRTPEAPIN